jgi:hypothetical protein
MDHELGLATSRRTLDRLDENAEQALGVEVGEPAVTVGPEAAAQSEQLDAVRGFNTRFSVSMSGSRCSCLRLSGFLDAVAIARAWPPH